MTRWPIPSCGKETADGPPLRTNIGADLVTWTFAAGRFGPIGIIFDLKPSAGGQLEAVIGTGSAATLRVTQWALLGEDFSIINAWIVVATLMTLELGLSALKRGRPRLDALLESRPLVIVGDGRVYDDRLRHEGIEVDSVLTAARELHGLERLDQIKYAVLERSGGISIVPAKESK